MPMFRLLVPLLKPTRSTLRVLRHTSNARKKTPTERPRPPKHRVTLQVVMALQTPADTYSKYALGMITITRTGNSCTPSSAVVYTSIMSRRNSGDFADRQADITYLEDGITMRLIAFLIVSVFLLVACDSTPAGRAEIAPTLAPTPNPAILGAPVIYSPTPEEEAVIDKLVARHPGADGEQLRASLLDPNVIRMELSNPADQALLREVYAKRSATQGDSRMRSARAMRITEATLFNVTLALVPSLGNNPRIVARVIRRHTTAPFELILLSEKTADAYAFGTALRILASNRASQGPITKDDIHIDIEGSAIPKNWDAEAVAAATDELQSLAKARIRTIPGVGRGRTTEILARSQ